MLSMRWNQFLVYSACDEIHSAYAQCAIKFVPRMLIIDSTCKTVHNLPLAEHAWKFVPRMLSVRWNRFLVGCARFASKNFSLISEIKRIWIRFTCVSLFHYKISLLFFRFFSLLFASNFSLRFTLVIFASLIQVYFFAFFRFFHLFSWPRPLKKLIKIVICQIL